MKKFFYSGLLSFFILHQLYGQSPGDVSLNNHKINGYRGIWFELNQKFPPYGDKYSGGLGTYTAKHIPLAIYSPVVNKTYFVYGGTTGPGSTHLLCMISYYDHRTRKVPNPTVVFDKMGVNDPHDNPSLLIDGKGYIWVFVSGRGKSRPGYKFRSTEPWEIDQFEQISMEEMTYPQPWYIENKGFIHLFTKYTGIRELYFETSSDGFHWTEDKKLAGIIAPGDSLGGHYQVSGRFQNKISTFFNRHPGGDPDQRTDLYYLQTTDLGEHWTNINGIEVNLPVTQVENTSRVIDYRSLSKNVYLKDLNFDADGNPICLFVTSGGHEPGPDNAPYEWNILQRKGNLWKISFICTSDHNYDMGSLFTGDLHWLLIAPTLGSPYSFATGGEIIIWESIDQGETWKQYKTVTRRSSQNHSYVRRPIQAQDPFLYFWADGNPFQLSTSFLFFGDSHGHYRKLPYEMNSPFSKPKKMK
jgi:hypothetical protein